MPYRKVSTIARIVNILSNNFSTIDIEVKLSAKDGNLEKSEYENGVLETFYQEKIEIIE